MILLIKCKQPRVENNIWGSGPTKNVVFHTDYSIKALEDKNLLA